MKTKGYKIIFSTDLLDLEIEENIDEFLREVASKRQISQVIEMSPQEIYEEIKKL